MRLARGLPLLVVVGLLAVALAGCIAGEGTEPPAWLERLVGAGESEPATESAESGWTLPSSGHHGTEVLMLGRSVMRDWFGYWGWNEVEPIRDRGFSLYYAELDSPPRIASSAAAYISQVPDGTTVVFKLCFVDFEAWTDDDIAPAAERNLAYAREVVEARGGRDVSVVLGTALPKVAGDTTQQLVEVHQRYNDGIRALAAENERVYVLDLYEVLVDQRGALPKGLAVTPDDSHLNDVAYGLLDEELFAVLEQAATE